MARLGLLCLIGVLAFATMTALADEPPPTAAQKIPKPTLEEIEQWIRDLNAPEFARREAATRQLIAAGADAAEPLTKAATSCSLEATSRITTILRTWYTSGKEELIEPAEVAFEQLVESKNRHMASRAVAVLETYATTIRQERAIAQIEKLGGTIEVSQFPGRLRVGGPDEMRYYMVILGNKWRGGEEGLKYLRRVSGLSQLYLMQDQLTGKIVTPGVTADAIDELRRALPALSVDYRGRAFLGIKTLANMTICRINEVPMGTPADRAMLQADDVVIGFNGMPIVTFQELVKLIATKEPGDVVKLEVLRGADDNELDALERLRTQPESDAAKEFFQKLRQRSSKTVDVTLGEWGTKPVPKP